MKHKSKILFVHKISPIEYRLLLGRRVSNNESFWWIPGGSVEQGESDFEAGLRELGEELFLTNDYIAALDAYTLKNEIPNKIEYLSPQAKNIIFIVPMFQATAIQLPLIKDEFEELAWHNLNTLPSNMSREFSYVQNQLESILKLI
ncbi:NUDIX hydrolase [uncultured Cytophaga sp.]|uniref:NUDIX hydrolase n=1 Tax=uncultured Cytophaga sp. TaxID=160238 RepID=UPI00260A4F46|nr:NUDIX hydrolase [uncultured Cytophaga sp.]